jgi:hypothetical protein
VTAEGESADDKRVITARVTKVTPEEFFQNAAKALQQHDVKAREDEAAADAMRSLHDHNYVIVNLSFSNANAGQGQAGMSLIVQFPREDLHAAMVHVRAMFDRWCGATTDDDDEEESGVEYIR